MELSYFGLFFVDNMRNFSIPSYLAYEKDIIGDCGTWQGQG